MTHKQKSSTTLVLIIFLLGIFIGALDSGIVSPAREIIQNSFGVNASYGTWMITIYTLFYAVSMPIISKLADLYGHKRVYAIGIAMFGLGSGLAGLANFYGTFEFFLIARVIQAIGAGGIIPIANAAISSNYPQEKRGFALSMIGGIYGIATMLGPSVGSLILQFTGSDQWGWLFFINVPIALVILVLNARVSLSNTAQASRGMALSQSLDWLGALVLTTWIGSLMYALSDLDFFHLMDSLKSLSVWPFLLVTLLTTPLLVWAEKRAKDPILNMAYFTNPEILKALTIAFFVGVGMMGMVFVPQFGENVLKLKAGTGGYLVTLLALFSGLAAPLSGKLIDSKGAKITLALGFIFTITGTLWMAFVVTQSLTFLSLLLGLALMGLGVGFSMGAPLNYIMLQAVPESEGTSALATLSVIRSIGVTLSPSFMIGFIVNAAKNLQGNLITLLEDLFAPFVPKGTNLFANASSNGAQVGFEGLKNADVTTIVAELKKALGLVLPPDIAPMAQMGIGQSATAIQNTFQSTINEGYQMMFIAAAILAALGLVATLALSNKKTSATLGSADKIQSEKIN